MENLTNSIIHTAYKVPVDRIFFFFLKHLTKTPKIPKDWAKMDDDRGRGAGRLELNDSIVESISVNNCIEAVAAHKKPKRKEKRNERNSDVIMTDERLIVPTYYMVALAAGTEPNQERRNKIK
jgi:hypothetical protein